MTELQGYEILPGSERNAAPYKTLGITASNSPVGITFHLRRKSKRSAANIAFARTCLPRSKVELDFGADLADMTIVSEFAKDYGLSIQSMDRRKRILIANGSAAQVMSAFKVLLFDAECDGHIFRTRSGPIFIPSELIGIITGVFGLDNRPQASSHLRFKNLKPSSYIAPDAFDGKQLSSIYNFPEGDGGGQVIGLIELGGGYSDSDTKAFFERMNLPVPEVVAVSVDGAKNEPGIDRGADTEVALDIQVAGSAANGAKIICYFGQNTSQGFLQAILAAVHDSKNNPSIISISWGSAELNYTVQQRVAMNEAFQTASLLGISVFVAAGDDGADDNVGDGRAHVDFPSSSPYATACGGSRLILQNGQRQESAWNDGDNSATGGGISEFFPRPIYQEHLSMPANLNGALQGRGLPDVAAVADPDTGYAVRSGGQWMVVGGTSAVAPLYAGLCARLNQATNKRIGLLNSVIYTEKASVAFNDITTGNNSCDGVVGYSASAGWDPVTGFGSPNGEELLKLFQP